MTIAGGQPGLAAGLMLNTGSLGLGESLALARRADRAGVGALGVGDGIADNFSVMGAVASVTESAELVTAITGWTRTPVTTALAGTTMQELSGGRYRLGLGTMPRAWSERWHGVDADRPAARMRDYVAAVRRAWCARPGEPVDHQGAYYGFSGYANPAGREALEPPPISLAVSRPRMARLAGEIADGVLFNLIGSPEWIAEVLLPAARAGREGAVEGESGRAPFDLTTLAYCVLDEDLERAVERVRPALGFYFAVPYFADVLSHHGFERELAAGGAAARRGDSEAMAAAVSTEMVTTFALVGSPEQVRRRLDAYGETLDRILLCPPIGQDEELTIELSERIVELITTTRVADLRLP